MWGVGAIVGLVDDVDTPLGAVGTPSEWSLATGVTLSVEDIRDGVAALLSGDAGVDNGSNVGVLVPVVDEHRTDGVNDDHGVVALAGDVLDQSVAVVPDREVVAIAQVPIDTDISFSCIGVDEDEGHASDVRNATSKSGDLGVCVVVNDRLDGAAVAPDLSLDGFQRSDQVWELSSTRSPAHGQSAVVTSTIGASVRSVLVLASIGSKDSGELLLASQRQRTGVLEQDCALDSCLADVACMLATDVDVLIDQSVVLLGVEVLESKGVLGPRGEVWCILDLVLVTANVVPRGDNADSHVVDTPLWDGAVEDSDGQVGTPVRGHGVEGHITGHGHVETGKSGGHLLMC